MMEPDHDRKDRVLNSAKDMVLPSMICSNPWENVEYLSLLHQHVKNPIDLFEHLLELIIHGENVKKYTTYMHNRRALYETESSKRRSISNRESTDSKFSLFK